MFYSSDFVETVLASALITTLFFGGWQVPFLYREGFQLPGSLLFALPSVLVMGLQVSAFVMKVSFFCFLLMLIRWTLPRFRWDHLMRLGWTIMLPLSIANILVTALLVLLGFF